jgi:hypothetical protein
MSCGRWRDRRLLALIGVLLLGASSAREALSLESAVPGGPDRHEITAEGSPSDLDADPQRIAAARTLAREHERNVAPRFAEARQPAETRLSTGSLPTPSRELAAGDCDERLASSPGRSEIARWCIAHATSTQAP